MTDLDDLRATLNDPPDFAARSLDLGQIMTMGGRRRRRRRIAKSAAIAVVTIALFAGSVQILALRHGPGRPDPMTPATGNGVYLGDVVATGLTSTKGRQWVIYGAPVRDPQLPETTFGFMLGDRDSSGITIGTTITTYIFTNETIGSDTAPGFHACEAAKTLDNGPTAPAFGYYVGTPAHITATAHGHTVSASISTWTYNPAITIFWFDTADVPSMTPLTHLKATAANGRQLPAGHTAFGPP